MFFDLLHLEFVFETLNYLVLHGHFRLYFLKLLLQDLLALLRLRQLLPQTRVGRKLLLEIVDLEVVFRLLYTILESHEKPVKSHELLYFNQLFSGSLLAFFQTFHFVEHCNVGLVLVAALARA